MRQDAVRRTDVARRVVAGAALAALAVLCPRLPRAAEAPRLDLRLTAVTALTADVRAALETEVQHLWRRSGVEVRWADAGSPPGTPVLRVLVVSRATPAAASPHSWPIAELLPDTDGHPVALASIDAAQRVLSVAHAADEPARIRNRRLGLVLGRAVAHEVGHRLLGTGHGRHGLMRARISAAEFADLRDGGFDLDRLSAVAAVTAVTARPLRIAGLPPRP